MDRKESYSLQELFDELPITIAELGRRCGANEVTVARIRNGNRARRDTANRLLSAFSEIYGCEINLRNVTGIQVQVNKRKVNTEITSDSTPIQ